MSLASTSRAQERREQILDAAYRLFAERGYHETNIAAIARELGLGHGTFYRYFENKLDIFSRVIDRVLAHLATAVAGEPPDQARSLEEYRAQVERIGHRLFDTFTEDPRLARLIFIESVGIDEGITKKRREALDLMCAVTEQYLINGVRRGFLRRRLDTQITARVLNATILDAAQQILATSGGRAAARDRWIAGVTQVVFEGIGA